MKPSDPWGRAARRAVLPHLKAQRRRRRARECAKAEGGLWKRSKIIHGYGNWNRYEQESVYSRVFCRVGREKEGNKTVFDFFRNVCSSLVRVSPMHQYLDGMLIVVFVWPLFSKSIFSASVLTMSIAKRWFCAVAVTKIGNLICISTTYHRRYSFLFYNGCRLSEADKIKMNAAYERFGWWWLIGASVSWHKGRTRDYSPIQGRNRVGWVTTWRVEGRDTQSGGRAFLNEDYGSWILVGYCSWWAWTVAHDLHRSIKWLSEGVFSLR